MGKVQQSHLESVQCGTVPRQSPKFDIAVEGRKKKPASVAEGKGNYLEDIRYVYTQMVHIHWFHLVSQFLYADTLFLHHIPRLFLYMEKSLVSTVCTFIRLFVKRKKSCCNLLVHTIFFYNSILITSFFVIQLTHAQVVDTRPFSMYEKGLETKLDNLQLKHFTVCRWRSQ